MKIKFCLIFLVLLIDSCTKNKENLEDNFNIIVESHQYKINLRERNFIRFYQNGSKGVNFKLSDQDQNEIKSYLLKSKFLLRNKEYNPFYTLNVFPVVETSVKIIHTNGKFNTTYCEPYTYFSFRKVKKIEDLTLMLYKICQKDPNVRKLPEPDIVLE